MRRFMIALIVGIVLFIGALAATVASAAEGDVSDETCVTVVDVPGVDAYDEVVIISEAIPAQHYSYTGGPVEGAPATIPPGDDWQANTTQEPHLNNPNVTWVDGFGVGLHYTSAGNSGKADYFYFQPAVDEVTETIHHDAIPPVTHEECTPVEPPCEVDCEPVIPPVVPPSEPPKAPPVKPVTPEVGVPSTPADTL